MAFVRLSHPSSFRAKRGISLRFPITILFAFRASYAILHLFDKLQGVSTMEWTTPQHEEIDLNCEISSYANAEI
jgi:hypothetical protein